MEGLSLDYFYGMQAEMFSFIRIPKILIKDGRFEKMSNDAKMLFGLLLDRMSLSMKNRWFDEEDRVYIIYTTDEIMVDLNIGSAKCVKLLKELEAYSLIERKKQGVPKPDIIYVKNFSILANDGQEIPKEAAAKVRGWRQKKTIDSEEKEAENSEDSGVFSKSKQACFENRNTAVFSKSKQACFENRNKRVFKIKT